MRFQVLCCSPYFVSLPIFLYFGQLLLDEQSIGFCAVLGCKFLELGIPENDEVSVCLEQLIVEIEIVLKRSSGSGFKVASSYVPQASHEGNNWLTILDF